VESVDVAQDGGQQRAVEDTLMNNGAPWKGRFLDHLGNY
jgi:hypothetical protein